MSCAGLLLTSSAALSNSSARGASWHAYVLVLRAGQQLRGWTVHTADPARLAGVQCTADGLADPPDSSGGPFFARYVSPLELSVIPAAGWLLAARASWQGPMA